MFDPELDSFKGIDLRAYAASQGYVLDLKESWRGCAVMRQADGDKIIIKRDADGHFVFFSVRDDRDNGTIIDFIQKRRRVSLGDIRKELRAWTGTPAAALRTYPSLPVTCKNRARVEIAYAKMEEAKHHPYLESERGIPAELLLRDRFAGRIRTDARGNAVFPHFDREGLCGYEIKNHGFTGFSGGGTKGLWSSQEWSDDDMLVFCESAIDALSHAVLFPNPRARYASIGGQINPMQPELMRAAVANMPEEAQIVAAMDADEGGRKLADVVSQAVKLTGRGDMRFVYQEPVGFNDWNDQLRGRPTKSSPYHPETPCVV